MKKGDSEDYIKKNFPFLYDTDTENFYEFIILSHIHFDNLITKILLKK